MKRIGFAFVLAAAHTGAVAQAPSFDFDEFVEVAFGAERSLSPSIQYFPESGGMLFLNRAAVKSKLTGCTTDGEQRGDEEFRYVEFQCVDREVSGQCLNGGLKLAYTGETAVRLSLHETRVSSRAGCAPFGIAPENAHG